MPRMGLTVTEYAAHAGISRQAVHKAERATVPGMPDPSQCSPRTVVIHCPRPATGDRLQRCG